MKKLSLLSIPVVLAFVSIAAGWTERPPAALRLGVFDSRAIAVAFARSEIHAQWMKELLARKEAAEKRGNEKEVAAVEAEGARHQRRFHLQGFSVAPIDDILVHIEKALPSIAEKAGVDAIVNRWNVVHHRPGVELVDVTEAMIAPFHPDEQTLAIVRDMKDKKPLDFEQAEHAD